MRPKKISLGRLGKHRRKRCRRFAEKNKIRQDLQDKQDIKAFGRKASRRRRKKIFTPLNHYPMKCLCRKINGDFYVALPISAEKANLTGAENPINPV
jgi:hypothetical protein